MHIPSHKHTPTDTHTQSQTARNTTHHHDSHGPYLQHSLYIRLQLQSVLQLIYPKQGRLGSNSDDADDDVEQDSDAGSKWLPQQRNPLSVTEISASFVIYNKSNWREKEKDQPDPIPFPASLGTKLQFVSTLGLGLSTNLTDTFRRNFYPSSLPLTVGKWLVIFFPSFTIFRVYFSGQALT